MLMYMTLSTDRYIVLKGVRVLGYLFWTTSDNWEWADGYGPKFGLVAVDRANNLAWEPRPSYYLFSKVCSDFSKLCCPCVSIVLWSKKEKKNFFVMLMPFFLDSLFCL